MPDEKPEILFVCSTNGGKSQLAAALFRLETHGEFDVSSAGVNPAVAINGLAAEVVAEVGADMSAEIPTALTRERMLAADRVVIVGSNASVDPVEGVRMERWVPDESAFAHLNEHDRMAALRDELRGRVRALADELGGADA